MGLVWCVRLPLEGTWIMTFIITLIALLLERFFHWHHVRHWRWFLSYERWLCARMSALPAELLLGVIALPPLLIIGALQYILAGWLWGALEGVLSVIVLLYCLGPHNLWVQAYRCIDQINKQEPTAIAQAQTSFGFVAADNTQAFHQTFVRAIFSASHQRIFAVFFWFILLGPVGAVLYRIMEFVSTQAMTGAKLASQIKGLLDWLPVRLETFLFALGGHFTEVFACWKRGVLTKPSTNEQFLTDCGMAALDLLEGGRLPETGVAEQAALALIDRIFVIGLVVLAMMVLLS